MKEKELESALEETRQRLQEITEEYQNSKKELQSLNKELKEAKIYAESIIETLHEPFLILYPDLRVKSANAAFYNHFEVHPQDTEGWLIYELGNGQWNIPELRILLDDVLPENNVFNDYEVEHEFEKIGKRVMLLNARRLDHVQFILLGIRDITQQKQDEEALRESEKRFRLMANAIPQIIWIIDAEGHVEFFNQNFFTYTGSSLMPATIQAVATGFIHPEDIEVTIKHWENAWQKGSTFMVEHRIKSASGEYHWFLVRAQPHLDPNTRKILRWYGTSTDIDQQKLMEQAAKQASKAKDEFVSTMSHEIRTPLNAIIGISNLLLKKEPRPQQMENLNALKFSSQNLLNLINDILDYSKIEAGKVELETVDYQLSTLIHSIWQSHRLMIEEKHNELCFQVAEGVPDVLRNDPHKLVQILNNLISNANKFTTEGTITLEVSLLKQERNEVELGFAVKDTGIGISKENIQKIFDKFKQANSSTMRNYGGTGLGLSITKSLLQLMGSDINVKSKEGEGSTFFFTLRQEIGNEENLSKSISTEKQENLPAMGQVKILLVEDADINRAVIQQHLQGWWALQADEATNGKEAVEKAKQTQYDLILMDKRMPEMDGIEAAHLIRNLDAHYAQVPMIILTADTDTTVEEAKKGKSTLFDAHITKPFDPEQLMKVISSLTGGQDIPGSTVTRQETKSDTQRSTYEPDFAKAEEPFEGLPEKKKKFYEMAITTLESFQTNYLNALEQQDAPQLNDLMHKVKLLFNILGLEYFYHKMSNLPKQIKTGTSAVELQLERTEIHKALEEIIRKIRIHVENLA